MRILHVTDGYRPLVGGIEIFVEDLARRQAAAGHEVSVLTATPAGAGPTRLGSVRVLRAPATALHPLAPAAARAAVLGGGYDVVHAHLSVVSPFATSVARAGDEAGLATVNTVHSMWGSRRLVVRAVRALAGWDRSTTTWTAVSDAAAEQVRAVLCPGADVHVVHNAVDVDWWRAEQGQGASLADRGPVTLVSVMRLAARKRPGALLGIVRAVRERIPGDRVLRLLVAGDGPRAGRLASAIGVAGLDDTVTMLGQLTREEIRRLYAGADVFVSAAYQESFGIAALEARAAGLPVVAMRAGGVGEFIEHGVGGLLCADDAAMADALTSLVSDAHRRRAIADHNAVVRPEQDWARAVAAFDAVYDRARLRAGAPRRPRSGLAIDGARA